MLQWKEGLPSWVKKKTTSCYLSEIHLKYEAKNWFYVKGQKKIYQANTNHMKVGLSLLISDTMDFKKTHKPEKGEI